MKQRTLTYGIFLILGILSLLSFTTLHDPLIHGFMALINGWDVVGWDKGIFTGYVVAEITAEQFDATPTLNVWLYYMLPSLVLFFLPAIIFFINPDRIIAMFAVVLMFLNFASLSPERLLESSDSSQALNMLLTRGSDPLIATLLHWTIFVLAIVTFFTLLWVIFEDNKEDSEKRIGELID